MKQQIEQLLKIALDQLIQEGALPESQVLIQVEASKDKKHGDFASNIALMLSKTAKLSPRALAEKFLSALPASPLIASVDIAGAGFINFFVASSAMQSVVEQILEAKEDYGRASIGQNKRVILEFVSKNPTGPLHVGHGRQAAFGLAVCNLLKAVGFKVYKEYYVNDAGRQMDILAISVWCRYLHLFSEMLPFPVNAYHGDYIHAIAERLSEQHGRAFVFSKAHICEKLPPDEDQGGDAEKYIDALIAKAKFVLGDAYGVVYDTALNAMLCNIREDLKAFGVEFDRWFSEREFVESGGVFQILDTLKQAGQTEEREGALWFLSSRFGDEKDRVLVRSNGAYTYFAPDLAYHYNKFSRGFDVAIDIFGADHHGYVPRIRAGIQAFSINAERLQAVAVQFVNLVQHGKPVKMSTRAGDFITFQSLCDDVGKDAVHFFYLLRRADQPIDFDIGLATSRNQQNPVYYVQYAYARIASVFKQFHERGGQLDFSQGLQSIHLLQHEKELNLLSTLQRFPDIISTAALQYEPYFLTQYLRELAADFHAYYNAQAILQGEMALQMARLCLLKATQQVLKNALTLLGVSAPESM